MISDEIPEYGRCPRDSYHIAQWAKPGKRVGHLVSRLISNLPESFVCFTGGCSSPRARHVKDQFRNRFKLVSMGRKAGGLYINPKKLTGIQKPCMKEMLAFLGCLSLNQNNDDRCVRQKELLNTCMDGQTKNQRKPWGSINYHLQRLSRGRK